MDYPRPALVCEGWLDTLVVSNSDLGNEWDRVYFTLTHQGLYCTQDASSVKPRSRRKNLPRKDVLIEFERRRGDKLELQTVYYIPNVVVAGNPGTAFLHTNTACCAQVSVRAPSESYTSRTSVSNPDPLTTETAPYYFCLAHVHNKKRRIRIFRTDSASEYVKWISYAGLFLHEGSATTLVPAGHPLELNTPLPLSGKIQHLITGKWKYGKGGIRYMTHVDPNPCKPVESHKIWLRCTTWNEGERERVLDVMRMCENMKYISSNVSCDTQTSHTDLSATVFCKNTYERFDACCSLLDASLSSFPSDNETKCNDIHRKASGASQSLLKTMDDCSIAFSEQQIVPGIDGNCCI